MAFTSGLTLTDLSDYLAPSQLCIKPVEVAAPTVEEKQVAKAAAALTEIIIDRGSKAYYEVDTTLLNTVPTKLKKAEITLNDCLACSGCITSAESVLVSMQSQEEVYRVLAERPDLTPIISFAPQSIASLAALHDLSFSQTMRGLRVFFKREFGFKLVFDTTVAPSLSLAENRLEFLERQRAHLTAAAAPLSTGLPTSIPSTATPGPLPVLSSACPGWICYAEKTHGELLPFVSAVKSSQAIMGTLVKSGPVAKALTLRPDEIYHVSVMPCYDKKLEASRSDFTTPLSPLAPSSPETDGIFECRDVDCVLTTGEVQKMLDQKSFDLANLAFDPLNTASASIDVDGAAESSFFPSFVRAQGSSSGGYLFNTIQAVVDSLDHDLLYRTELLERKVRAEDYVEFTLVASNLASISSIAPLSLSSASSSSPPSLPSPASGTTTTFTPYTLLRAAKCYGFRNLQNVVRKIGRDSGVAVTRGAALRLPSTFPSSTTSSSLSSSSSSSSSSLSASALAAAAARRLAASNRRKNKLGGTKEAEQYRSTSIVDEEKAFDYVEVMACPSGCVNGGGQITPPAVSTLRSTNRRSLWIDAEGMPDVESQGIEMQVDGVSDATSVLSGREWVARVEDIYWTASSPTSTSTCSTDVDSTSTRRGIDMSRVHPSLFPFLYGAETDLEIARREQIVEDLLLAVGLAGRETRRRELFRTQYRAVEVAEVNGLAVVW